MFHVGQLVVCVDASPPRTVEGIPENWGAYQLAVQAVYRVADTRVDRVDGSRTGLKFECQSGCWWLSDRFRPAVTDNKACDADFRALLKRPARKSVEA